VSNQQLAGARKLARRILPNGVGVRVDRARHKRTLTRSKDLDLSRIDLIGAASRDELLDPRFLELELLPALGFNDEVLDEFPAELHGHCGEGLRHWQYPNQFAPYLVGLSRRQIRSYLEIGCRHGGTFVITVEYLSRFGNIDRAIAADILAARPSLKRYVEARPGAQFVKADSQSERFRDLIRKEGPFDLVLIDGDHSHEGCQRDLDNVKPHTSIIVLHDIVSDTCPGVPAVWREFRATGADEWEFHEYADQYEEVRSRTGSSYLGIGVAVRKEPLT
jgi:cephalosporin hydroxylase